MKRILASVLLLALVACAAPAAEADPTQSVADPTATDAPAPTEELAATGLPIEAATYRDDTNGFELDYPAAWNEIGGEGQSRGYYRQIVSWDQEGPGVEQVPEGGSVLQITVNLWEPVNDLDARLEMRRNNYTASGNVIVEEEGLTLPSGVYVVRILLQTNTDSVVVYFTTLNDLYLEISGNGDIATLDAAIQTLRIDGVNP